jgi:CBS domain-containing protein
MTPEIEYIDAERSLFDAASRMKSLDVGIMPVVENEKLVGTITDRDITVRGVAAGRDPAVTPVRDAMTAGVITAREDADVETAINLMKEHQVRRIFVSDAEQKLVGVISLGDVAKTVDAPEPVAETVRRVSQPA